MMILKNKTIDYKHKECLSDIFFNLMNYEKSFNKNFLTFLLLKFTPSDIYIMYNNHDSNTLSLYVRSNGESFFIGNFSIYKNKYLLNFGNYTSEPYIFNEIIETHINHYINNIKEFRFDSVENLKLSFYGECRIRSASEIHNSGGISINMRILMLNQTYTFKDVFKPILSNKTYLKTLSEKQLDTISYFYKILTDISINFNDDNFDKYLSIIDILLSLYSSLV